MIPKKKDRKTTIFSWVLAVGLLLGQADSPIAPLLPPVVKQAGGLIAIAGTLGLGKSAADSKLTE